MGIQFTVPSNESFINPTTLTTAEQLRDWSADLPAANLPAMARSVGKMLSQINRHPEAIPARLDLMIEILKPAGLLIEETVGNLLSAQEKHAGRSELTLVRSVEPIISELAFGFKHCINDTIAGESLSTRSSDLSLAIYQSIRLLSMSQLFAYSRYQPLPQNLAREINLLYRYALQHKLNRQPLDDPEYPAERPVTIDLAYKRSLLTGLLDPYHLPKGEVWHVFNYLSQRADSARLMNYSPSEQARGCYLISPDPNRKPQRLDKTTPPDSVENYLMLELVGLNTQVHADRQRYLEKSPPEELQRLSANHTQITAMLHRMLVIWHLAPARRSSRQDSYHWIKTVVGVKQIHRYLRSQMVSRPKSDVEEQEIEVNYDISRYAQATDTQDSATSYRWHEVNKSVSGRCVELTDTRLDNLNVGDLVLMEQEGYAHANWELGLIKRMLTQSAGNRIELGIQFVLGVVQSATIIPEESDGTIRQSPKPAILVQKGSDSPDFIYTLPSTHHAGSFYRLEPDITDTRVVRADKLIAGTPNYDWFEVSSL